MLQFTERAVQILQRAHEAARRFNPEAMVKVHRRGDGVAFDLTDRPEEGDEVIEHPGFAILAERGLTGVVDVVEPHDRLVLIPAGTQATPDRYSGTQGDSALF